MTDPLWDYRGIVWTVCFDVLGNPDDAEDAVQETFLNAWAAKKAPPPEDTDFQWWIQRVARNAAIDVLRKRRRRRAMESGVDHDQLIRMSGGSTPAASTREPDFDPSGELMQVVDRLAQQHETVATVRLYYITFENAPVRVLSDHLGIQLNTARTRLHRGREKLRGVIADGGFRFAATG